MNSSPVSYASGHQFNATHLPQSSLSLLWWREQTASLSRDSTDLAQLLLPQTRVELAEDSLDLPGLLLSALVGSLEDVDALDRSETLAESRGPAESNGVAGHGVDGEDAETDGRLTALASLEGLLAGERGAAEGS